MDGKKIDDARRNKKWRWTKLIDEADISSSTLANARSGVLVDKFTAEQIASALDVDYNELLTREDRLFEIPGEKPEYFTDAE